MFDLAVDSLCDWFSADEMNQIIATAQEQAGTRWQLDEFEADDCLVQEPPVSWPGPFAWNTLGADLQAGSTVIDSGQPNLMVNMVPVAWTDLEPAEDFVGDEMLDASITYGNPEHECGWDESMSFDLRVDGHEDEVLRFVLARPNNLGAACNDELVEAEATSLAFALAEAMLTSMNWIE